MDSRSIDALVAEKVMGWTMTTVYHGLDNSTADRLVPPDGNLHREIPEYSDDISAAWQVVEKIDLFSKYLLWRGDVVDGDNKYRIGYQEYEDLHQVASAETAPLVICLAALSAVGVEVEASPAE